MRRQFGAGYRKQFSFLMRGKPLVVEAVSVEAIAAGEAFSEKPVSEKRESKAAETVRMFTAGAWHSAPLYRREELGPGVRIDGPSIIAEANSTTVVEPDWRAE